MPAALPVVATMIAAALTEEAIIIMAVAFASSLVAGQLERSMQDSAEAMIEPSLSRGLAVNTRSTQEPLKVIYGRQRVGGNTVFAEPVGTDNDTFWLVQTLGEGECEGIYQVGGIDQIFLGDILVNDYPSNLVYYWFHPGSSTQTYNASLNAAISKWTDNMRYTSYLVWKFIYDRDYFQGIPNRTVVLKGRKLYDFRNASTAWSDNPVLCLYDYVTNQRYGMGISAAKLDIGTGSSWNDAANYCDTKGWTFNYAVTKKTSANDVLNTIYKHFRGCMTEYNGKFYLRYADLNYESSVMTLKDEHLHSDASGKAVISIGEQSRFSKPDGLRVIYIDPDKEYVDDEVLVGEEVGAIDTFHLPGCLSRQQAADIGTYILERLQLNRTITGRWRGDAVKLEPHDPITLNTTALAISNQLMRVAEANIQGDDSIELTLHYEDITLYDDDYNLDTEGIYSCNLPDPNAEPPAVSFARVVEEVYSYRGRSFTKLRVTFNRPSNYPWFDFVEVYLSKTPIGHWKLDESVGINASDTSGYGSSGVLKGGMGDSNWVAGKTGNSLDFDGSDDRVDFGNPNPINSLGDGSFSIMMAINADSPIKSNGGIFSKYEDDDNRIEIGSDGINNKLKVEIVKGGISISNVFDDLTPFDEAWPFIFIVVDRESNRMYAYVDTTKSSEEINIESLPTDCSNDGYASIGARYDGSQPYDGKIDEVRVYDVALMDADIAKITDSPDSHAYEHAFKANSDFEIDPVEEGRSYWIRLKVVNIRKVRQQDENDTILSKAVFGYIDVPESLGSLQAIVNQNSVNLYSYKVEDSDIELYEFRLGSSWSGGIFLSALRSPNLSLFGVKPGSHTFLINTLGNNGRYGAVPRSASVSLIDPPDGWSISATETCDYDGIGTHNNTEHTTYLSDDYLKCSHSY